MVPVSYGFLRRILAAGMICLHPVSFCGVAGEVVIGNALCDERSRVLLTPSYYLGGWSGRLHLLRNKVA